MNILIGALLFFIGGIIGISIMCIVQVGARSDEILRSDKLIQSSKTIDKEPPLK